MPTTHPTGFETYIHDLPQPKNDEDTGLLIMVEPSYASGSDDVYVFVSGVGGKTMSREIAEQFRDALIKVCSKPKKS